MTEEGTTAGASVTDLLRPSGVTPGDARALMRAALRVDDAWLAAHPEQTVSGERLDRYRQWVVRRRNGEPVAYLTGEREFYSLSFKVSPAVLIPRPETELLVEVALARLSAGAPGRVLDLATGSGCIAIAIAKHRPRARVTAADIAPEALAVARENAARHGVDVEFVHSDWFSALAGRRFDLIVANPPYVAEGDPHLAEGDLRYEPRRALVAGPDGLACIRRIAAEARARLEPGGALWFEHGYDQAQAARALLSRAGFAGVSTRRDLAGIERVCGGFDGALDGH